jgi:hypothetical protein
MTNLMFLPGMREPAPMTVDKVTQQRAPEPRTDPPAELTTGLPEYNQVDTDTSDDLTGLAHRQLGGDENETVKYDAWWIPLAEQNHNAIIDNQIAESGTAAGREAAGIQGHGSMQFTESIEPVVRDGFQYGSDYFKSHEDGTGGNVAGGNYMSNAIPDIEWQGVAAELARANSRDAYAGMYDNILGGSAVLGT